MTKNEKTYEVATLATLEIAPAHADERWLLTVSVKDEIGPSLIGNETTIEREQRIDIDTFYNVFIRPGRGTANVTAQVDSPSARAAITRLLHAIEPDQHVGQVEPSSHEAGWAQRFYHAGHGTAERSVELPQGGSDVLTIAFSQKYHRSLIILRYGRVRHDPVPSPAKFCKA